MSFLKDRLAHIAMKGKAIEIDSVTPTASSEDVLNNARLMKVIRSSRFLLKIQWEGH
jgi:hypothetical protein